MEEIDHLLDLPSPSNSLLFTYHDQEAYMDSSTTTASTSPSDTPVWALSTSSAQSLPNQRQYDHTYNGTYANFEDHTDDSGDIIKGDAADTASTKPAAKRKRENRYKNAPPSVLSRRRAQNRASQRAYRERKDQRIKDLEVLLNEAQQKNDVLSQAYTALQSEYIKLKTDQATAVQYHHHHHQAAAAAAAAMGFDPNAMGGGMPTTTDDMNLFLYHDATAYPM
ncbi:bZIP transcription factor [Apiospora saccharicola]|uniref:Putative transcription factor kapC n=1 Tax=Apiospora saccharicola TaxID=335842 RepID=A0ABR1WII2_9PEZI